MNISVKYGQRNTVGEKALTFELVAVNVHAAYVYLIKDI
jgi:hypothetical protein